MFQQLQSPEVKWYNGHPDYQDLKLPSTVHGESAVVLGQGNVALDVARLLVRPPRDLDATDMERAAVPWVFLQAAVKTSGSSGNQVGISMPRIPCWGDMFIEPETQEVLAVAQAVVLCGSLTVYQVYPAPACFCHRSRCTEIKNHPKIQE